MDIAGKTESEQPFFSLVIQLTKVHFVALLALSQVCEEGPSFQAHSESQQPFDE